MKTLLLASIATTLLAGSAFAGGVRVYVNTGGYGCAPRVYAPPVCYAPRPVYYAAPVVCYRPAPVVYYRTAPRICAPAYRAPIVTGGVAVGNVAFGWRR